jgi:hypothetical protein
MSYTVTTEPDIGGGEGSGFDGTYSVPIQELEYDKIYNWTITVTDGSDTVEKKLGFITKSIPPFDPFDEGWQYKKEIVINHSHVSGNLENFPILISILDNDLRNTAQEDGDDILFMDGSGIANKLYHEIEKYNSSSGELISWVNVEKIDSDKDTTLYIYYGNPVCSSQQFTAKVWDSNYKIVYHMNYDSEGLIDSTTNKNDCNTVIGDPEYHKTGKIGYAIELEYDNKEAFEDGDILDGLNEITVEAWINLESYHKNHNMIASHEDSWYFHVQKDLRVVVFDIHGGESGSSAKDNILCPLEEWYYVAGTWSDPNDRMQLFANGELKGTYIETLHMLDSPYHFAVGFQEYSVNYFDGVLDEIRISDIERSEDWIKTTYQNQNDPSGFLSIGPEETAP